MTEMKARLVDKDGNPLGTAANPLKISGDVGGGVPDGGTAGQVLQKKTDADQDTEWGDGSGAATSWGSITGTLSDQTDLNTALNGKATKTDSDFTLYVYEDATGDADGSSKTNAYTTLQAAIDAIPDVAQNVTVIVCKGSTNYLGQTTTIQKASVKSLTIQGEFYAYDACDANAVAGKIVDASADFSDFEVGDRVVCAHYSGTVGWSSIDDYFYATVTEVGSGYVQTSEGTKVPTTGWRYLINQTQITSVNDIVAGGFIDITSDFFISIKGVSFTVSGNSGDSRCAIVSRGGKLYLNCCMFEGNQGAIISQDTTLTLADNYFNVEYIGVQIVHGTHGDVYRNVVVGTPLACFYMNGGANPNIKYGYMDTSHATGYAIFTDSSMDNAYVDRSYIGSSCTYGAYGYNITLSNCTNNAATPVYNLTSGGSIEEWDGLALNAMAESLLGETTAAGMRGVLASASSTTAAQNIYVDSAATGAGTGVDWTNAFTTIQAAVDSLPAIINHPVTIYIRKGSTAYDEQITVQRVVASGSIELRGEYYWTGTVATGGTGKFTLSSSDPHYADRAQIAAGDKVILMAYSGTVEGSTPSASYVDTVASVNGAEITLTTNTGITTTTSFTYQIVKTEVICSTSNQVAITINSTSNVSLIGLYISHSTYRGVLLNNSRACNLYSCYIGKHVNLVFHSLCSFYRCYFEHSGTVALQANAYTRANVYFSRFGVSTIGANPTYLSTGYLSRCHITSDVTTGVSAGALSLAIVYECLNNATTAKSPASNPGTDGGYVV